MASINRIIKDGWNTFSTSLSDNANNSRNTEASYIKVGTLISGSDAYCALKINAVSIIDKEDAIAINNEKFTKLYLPNTYDKNVRDSVYNHFDNRSNSPIFYPYLEYNQDNSAVVTHIISGKNLMSCWQAHIRESTSLDIDFDLNLEWEIPDWIEHDNKLSVYPDLKIDYSASKDNTAIYTNHNEVSLAIPSGELLHGYERLDFINSKSIQVSNTTFSGALLEIRCSGDRGSSPVPHTMAPVTSEYQKPIIVQSGVEMIASCLIKTESITNNNYSYGKYKNGAGFTVSFIDDTVTSTGSENGLLQVYETPMAGGLTGDNPWTYCSIIFTPTTNVVNFRLWLKDEVGSAVFSDFRLGVLSKNIRNVTIPTENIVNNYISNSNMYLYSGSFRPFPSNLSSSYGCQGPMIPSRFNCTQVVISGPGWGGGDITTFSGFGETKSVLNDKTIAEFDERVHDEFKENSLILLKSSGSLGFENIFVNAEYSDISLTSSTPNTYKYLVSLWYSLDENNPVSGNCLFKAFNSSESVEDIRCSTEHNKWIYHEIMTSGVYPVTLTHALFGIPQPRGNIGQVYIDGVSVVAEGFARSLENELNGWSVINNQPSGTGFIFTDKHERLAYYNYQSNDIAKISSRSIEKIGLYQDLDIDNRNSYRLKIAYKNQSYGSQNLINKSEAFHDETTWGSSSKWTSSGTLNLYPSEYLARLIDTERSYAYGDYEYNYGYYNGIEDIYYDIATLFEMTTTTGSYYMNGIETNFFNMSSSLNNRQFVATIKAKGLVDKTDIVFYSDDGEYKIFDSIESAGSQDDWKNYSIVGTFSGSPSTSILNFALNFSTATTYSGYFTGVQIYETDGSLEDGFYVDTLDLEAYAPTNQSSVGYPISVASGLYYTITLSGNEALLYLQEDNTTWSEIEYKHQLEHSNGEVLTQDATFSTPDIFNGVYSIFIGTDDNKIPEASWIYKTTITDDASYIVSESNPISFGSSIKNINMKTNINNNIESEYRIISGLNIITSGGTFTTKPILLTNSFNYNTISLNEVKTGLKDIDFSISQPNSYEYILDDLKYGFADKLIQTIPGIDGIDINSKLMISAKYGGSSDLDNIFELSYDKLVSNADISWGKTSDTCTKALVYGTEFEASRTAKHIVGVYQIDKKGRYTTIPFDEFASLGIISNGERQQVFNGYLHSRNEDRNIDMNISIPMNMVDYATPDSTRQAFGVIYPTDDYGNPTNPRQAGDGIMFKKGVKRFCSTMIKNPDFIDTNLSGGAVNWNYNNIDENNSLSFEDSKFGYKTLKLTPASGENYVYQDRQWQDSFGQEFTISCWFKTATGSYGMISAINYETGVEHFLKVEGTGEWKRIYKTLNAAHAAQPIDLGTITRSTDGTISTNIIAYQTTTFNNNWGFRVWGTTSENGGQGDSEIFYDGFNVFNGTPKFHIIDADLGSQGLNISWDIEDSIKEVNGDVNSFIFSKIVGFSYENSHVNAAQYYNLDIIDGAGIVKTKEIEVKFLSSLYKALMIARKEVVSNSIDLYKLTLDTVVPMLFLNPRDKIRLKDPNSGMLNEIYTVISNEVVIEGGDASGQLVLKRIK